MAFLARAIEFLFWVVIIGWLFRKLFGWLSGTSKPRQAQVPPISPRPLYRDPWCGTFVSSEISHSLEQAGQTLHFCSDECRARYLASLRHAARA